MGTTPKQAKSSTRTPARPAAQARGGLDEATRMAKALSHPLRHRILYRLNERVASPVQLAEEFGEPLQNVSYHVRTLLDLDCVELVDTAQRRGAIEHYYRATRRAMIEDTAWERLPPSARRGFAGEWFKKTFDNVSAGIEFGSFDRDDCHLSFTSLVLDDEAWAQLAARLEEVVHEAFELQAESAGRLQEAGDDAAPVETSMVIVQYEAPPPPSKRTKSRTRRKR